MEFILTQEVAQNKREARRVCLFDNTNNQAAPLNQHVAPTTKTLWAQSNKNIVAKNNIAQPDQNMAPNQHVLSRNQNQNQAQNLNQNLSMNNVSFFKLLLRFGRRSRIREISIQG